MNRFVPSKSFYRGFFALTLGLALQNLLTYSVNLADNVMIGNYDQNAMSAISVCNQFQFLLQMLVVGVGEGIVVLGAQYWGKKEFEPIRHIVAVGLRFALWVAGILFLLAIFAPAYVLGLLVDDGNIVAEGVKYLQIVGFSYLIFTATNILSVSLRTVGIVKVGYWISFSTLCINITLNYCLIYGNFGCPELGIQGAAIATLTSRFVELCIVCYFLKFKEKTLNLTLKRLIFMDKSYYKDYRQVALPLLVTQGTWGLATIVQTGIIGNMPQAELVIPANAVAVLAFQIISVVGYGAASAAAMLTGKAMGEGNMTLIKQQTFTFQVIFLGLGLVTGAGIFLAKDFILGFYPSLSIEAAAMTRSFMDVIAITSIGTCYQMATDVGIIRAGGSPSFSMKNNFIFIWGIVIPLAYLSAFVWHLPPIWVFFCLKSDQITKAPVIFWYANSYRWMKNVTRDKATT